MNAYEIEQVERQVKADFRLPLGYEAWADIEHKARQQRARATAETFSKFFAAVLAKVTGFARQMRSTAAECTDARLRHDH
jgi:ppGpp synthetase/RelA/SpoT-type nucleotidyltranferase